MMYGPAARGFLAWAARARRASARDGLGMLVEQAAEAFHLWRGVRPATAPVLAALRARLDDGVAMKRARRARWRLRRAAAARRALALQLYFLLRIALMAVVDPQSTTFQRSEAWRLADREPRRMRWRQQWVAYAAHLAATSSAR